MKSSGKIKDISKDFETNRILLTVELQEQIGREELSQIRAQDLLDITIEKHKKKRSNDANALLWACIRKLASAMRSDKWSIYLLMLKRYGKYTYVCVPPKAVDSLCNQWRETEVIGEIDINGRKAMQVLCYFGSSSYNTQEFSHLLDGVISEMQELGIETPQQEELRLAIEAREKRNNG